MKNAITFVDAMIEQAMQTGASDIHFETRRSGLYVKFRLDGVMSLGPQVEGQQKAEEVISRIKVMAQLDITERRKPQDGRIHWSVQPVDLRVSVMPSLFGEDVVLRVLDKSHLHDQTQAEQLTLASLGFGLPQCERIRDLASRPHGMLLITGPTGSGKTTTAYAALSEVNNGLEKIVTIEDPVEYELQGTLQIPVNEQKGLTFARGLRSILRHDPDKILVGEIRDAETAQIAVQSALTGHLVFTTVHANSLPDVLGRFEHFAIDPFGLASALNGVVVQRLMRKLCPSCMAWSEPENHESRWLQKIKQAESEKFPRAVGCPTCRGSGYKGRFVLAQVHTLGTELRDAIIVRRSLAELESLLAQESDENLMQQALSAVHQGHTTLEEVHRVIGWE